MQLDLDFLAGRWLNVDDIPLDKVYLAKYFHTDVERTFLAYYLIFQDLWEETNFLRFYHNFVDHTGIAVTRRWIKMLWDRVRLIEATLAEAGGRLDFDLVGEIKGGRFKVK